MGQVEEINIKQNRGLYLTYQQLISIGAACVFLGGLYFTILGIDSNQDVIEGRLDRKFHRTEEQIQELHEHQIDFIKFKYHSEGYQEGFKEGQEALMKQIKFTHYTEQ